MSKILSSLVLFSLIPSTAVAQITPDSSLGTEKSVVDSSGNRDTIKGGAMRDANLFHSFQEFNVEALREAYFANPQGIANIFSRVTGNNLSDIQGVLGVLGDANLYLINPNGILFGENARLDVNGSFFATTADSVLFDNGWEFSAVNPNQPPLLKIDIPIGLRFRDNPGDITVRGKGNGARLTDSEIIDTQEALRVNSDSTIGLIGGNLLFEDATIKTAGGRIELGSVAGGEVNLVEVANGFTVDYSGIESFRDISLAGRSVADASGIGSGDIQVAGRNISLTGVSGFTSFTLGSKSGGDINILATESLEISGVENELNFVSGIISRIFPKGTAEAGDIKIKTGSLRLGDRALISTSVFGQGNAGDININAKESISLASQGNTSAFISSVATGAIGNGGDIKITTGSLALSNGALIDSSTLGQGNAGNVTVSARDFIVLEDKSNIFAFSSFAKSNAGNITLNTNSLTLNNGGTLAVASLRSEGNAGNISINATGSVAVNNQANLFAMNTGQGKGGNVIINATDNVSFTNGSNISVNASDGNSGNIELNTGSLILNNKANLFALNTGQGKGGKVTINATDNVSFNNNSNVFVTGEEGGLINISAKNLSLKSDSNFTAGINRDSGFTDAQSGDIVINLTEDLVLDGADGNERTSINNINFSTGNIGNIKIKARNITFRNGGSIVSLSYGKGNIGNINLTATGNILFDGLNDLIASGIFNSVEEGATGDIGEINIAAQNLALTNGGRVKSVVTGIANSGDINLNIAETIRIDGFGEFALEEGTEVIVLSGIFSEVEGNGIGNSGTINIKTNKLNLARNGFIQTAMVGRGNAGNIIIDATDAVSLDGTEDFKRDERFSNLRTGIFSAVLSEGVGNGGNIKITTGKLSLNSGSQIGSTISGRGKGGIVNIEALESISLEGVNGLGFPTAISTRIQAGGMGNAGKIILNTRNLTVANGAEIDSSTFGKGNAGSVTINATDAVSLEGKGRGDGNGGISSSVELGAVGKGGKVEVNATNLFLTNGAQILSATFGKSTPGSITINVVDTVSLDGGGKDGFNSAIGSGVDLGAIGTGGQVFINAKRLLLTDGAAVTSTTRSNGKAGDLIIRASDSVEISGVSEFARSGLSATAIQGSGNGGNIKVFTDKLIVSDGANINASNFSSIEELEEPGTGEAGSVRIEANNITLENGGRINVATQAGDNGNITLKVTEDIILKDNSLISARALKEATGGNIDIDARFIVAFPNQNSDIIASAERGQGGNIDITAEAIFGIEERSSTPPNKTNDIDASSEFGLSGTVNITQPDVNPTSGLLELTQDVVDPADLIAQNVCTQTANSEFIDIGKGGLPQNPEGMLAGNAIEVELATPIMTSRAVNRSKKVGEVLKPQITRKPPAQGWIWYENGMVELVAYNPHQVGEQRTWSNTKGCQ